MNTLKKPDASLVATSSLSNNTGRNYTKQPTKRETILTWLIDESECGSKVTRFDAEYIRGHAYNNTVSEIERFDGVRISRQRTKRPTRFGRTVPCCEYWISKSELIKAKKVLVLKPQGRSA